MGRMEREKGKRFERDIARQLRSRWPNAIVRRSTQSDGAHRSDVWIDGEEIPPVLRRLWLELQDAADPTPLKKLAQAERDSSRALLAGAAAAFYPVVVWHRIRERTVWATLRLETLCALSSPLDHRFPEPHAPRDMLIVTLDFEDLVASLDFDEPALPTRST